MVLRNSEKRALEAGGSGARGKMSLHKKMASSLHQAQCLNCTWAVQHLSHSALPHPQCDPHATLKNPYFPWCEPLIRSLHAGRPAMTPSHHSV